MAHDGSTSAMIEGRGYARYVLIMLILANVLSIADRSVMALLLEPIKRDIGASDTSMSLLTGASFVIFYSLFGIPIARWADVGNRRGILAAGVAVWSLMTALCGAAGSFAEMALARAGVGVGEASVTPTAISLIADYYERKARVGAIALFNMAPAFSAFLIMPLLAVVADRYGWRQAFYVVAAPGLIMSLAVRLTIREPARGRLDGEDATASGGARTSFAGAIRIMAASPPFMLILLGTTITGLGAWTLGAWGPALMMRAYGLSATQVAVIYGPLTAAALVLGGLGGGYLTGWVVAKRRSERWIVLLPALVSLPTIPAGVLFSLSPTFALMALGGCIGSFTIAFRTAPHMAVALDLVPPDCRGVAASAIVIAFSVVGQALGPLAVGMLSDHLAPEVGLVLALRYGMIFAPATLALGVIPFFLAVRYFDDAGVKPHWSAAAVRARVAARPT